MPKNKILVVDDEVDFTKLLKSNLEETGKYEVLALPNANDIISQVHGFKPDIIISSHAVRAQETAKLMAEGLDCPLNEIVIDEKVYESNIENLFNIVYGIPNDKNTLIMIGHNPTITNFANYFLTEYVDYMPTSAVVCVEFDTDKWNEIVSVKKQTRFIIYPKMLK